MSLEPFRNQIHLPIVKRIPVKEKEQEDKFLAIQELIDAKRQMLLNKQKKLRFVTKQNRFLDSVKNDYAKYYHYITEQKKDQIKALELLENYINDLTVSGKLSKHNIEDAKEEQSRILREVKSIKMGMDSLIEGNQDHDPFLKN